jgi:hypothetical protein
MRKKAQKRGKNPVKIYKKEIGVLCRFLPKVYQKSAAGNDTSGGGAAGAQKESAGAFRSCANL